VGLSSGTDAEQVVTALMVAELSHTAGDDTDSTRVVQIEYSSLPIDKPASWLGPECLLANAVARQMRLNAKKIRKICNDKINM
jgi:hypothetical protein